MVLFAGKSQEIWGPLSYVCKVGQVTTLVASKKTFSHNLMVYQYIFWIDMPIITRRGVMLPKEDLSAEESEGHPDLNTSKGPATMNAHVARHRSRKTKVRESLKEREGNDEECIENDETTDECQPKE